MSEQARFDVAAAMQQQHFINEVGRELQHLLMMERLLERLQSGPVGSTPIVRSLVVHHSGQVDALVSKVSDLSGQAMPTVR